MNFIAVNGDMVQPAAKRNLSEAGVRTISALVLAPFVLAATYVGTPLFELLVAAAALAMSWEWSRVCNAGRFEAAGGVFAATVLLALALGATGGYDIAVVVLGTGAIATAITARAGGARHPGWTTVGVIAVGVCCLALIWLRTAPVAGMAAIFWLLGTVWATDIGAYVTGRLLGGPKLAPRISPRKTWAGLIGGMLTAAATGLIVAAALDRSAEVPAAIAGAGMALISQCGDLVESAIKRHFGVKDMSGIIPGHGGMFDRVDGVAAGMVAVAVIQLTTGGLVLEWQ